MPQDALGLPSRKPAAYGLASEMTQSPRRTLPPSPIGSAFSPSTRLSKRSTARSLRLSAA
jgi:hypothetical protein